MIKNLSNMYKIKGSNFIISDTPQKYAKKKSIVIIKPKA